MDDDDSVSEAEEEEEDGGQREYVVVSGGESDADDDDVPLGIAALEQIAAKRKVPNTDPTCCRCICGVNLGHNSAGADRGQAQGAVDLQTAAHAIAVFVASTLTLIVCELTTVKCHYVVLATQILGACLDAIVACPSGGRMPCDNVLRDVVDFSHMY